MKKEVLRLEHIDLIENNNKALDGFNLNVLEGELVCAFGFLGCGTEQLTALLSGKSKADSGRILFDETSYAISQKITTEKLGIYIMERGASQVPDFTVAENIFVLWRMQMLKTLVSKKAMQAQARLLLDEFGLELSTDRLSKDLSEAQQQTIKLIKAYAKQARLVVAHNVGDRFTQDEMQQMQATLKVLQKNGVAVLWLSNKPDPISRIADRVMLLSKGRNIKTYYAKDYNEEAAMRMLASELRHPAQDFEPVLGSKTILEVKELRLAGCPEMNFSIRAGEIIGFLDEGNELRGSLHQLLLGGMQVYSGMMSLHNTQAYRPKSYRDALRARVAYISGTNIENSFISNLSVLDNLMLPILKRSGRLSFTSNKVKRFLTEKYAPLLNLSAPEMRMPAHYLDHHQMLKLQYLRWMLFAPDLLLLDEPFAYTDSPTRNETIRYIQEFARNGTAVLLSSVSPEGLSVVCKQVIKPRDGRLDIVN